MINFICIRQSSNKFDSALIGKSFATVKPKQLVKCTRNFSKDFSSAIRPRLIPQVRASSLSASRTMWHTIYLEDGTDNPLKSIGDAVLVVTYDFNYKIIFKIFGGIK